MARNLRERKNDTSPRVRIAQILMLVLVLAALCVVWVTRMAHNYVYMFLDHYDGTTAILAEAKGLQRSESDLEKLLPLQQAFDDWKQTHLRDDVSVTAEDGAELRGGLYDAGSGVTVVMLHSFDGSSAGSDYLLAPYFAGKGYNILLPDSRDHGESGGDHVTYGLLEGSDTAAWVRFLLERYGPDHRVILQGADLGANAALTGAALLQGDPDNAGAVAFAAVRAPIENLYDEANYLLKKQFGIPGVVVSLADRYARVSLGGHSMGEVSLGEMTAGCTVPILAIRETGDTVIDPAGAKAFSEAYAGSCTVLELTSAHGMGYAENTATCEAALDDMISACLDGQG